MKSLLTFIALFSLATTVFAHDPQSRRGHGKKKMAKVVVKGEKAKSIFEAMDAEIVTKDRKKFTADIKTVAKLKCVKLIKKEDTSVEKFRCSLAGKLVKKKPARRGNRGERGQRRGRGHGQRGGHGNQRG